MRAFTRPFAFLLVAFGLCSLPWSSAGTVLCDSEITCGAVVARSSLEFGKRQDFTNAERLRKRLPLLPPSRVGLYLFFFRVSRANTVLV